MSITPLTRAAEETNTNRLQHHAYEECAMTRYVLGAINRCIGILIVLLSVGCASVRDQPPSSSESGLTVVVCQPPASGICVQVVGPDLKPLPSVEVFVLSNGEEFLRTRTNQDGYAAINFQPDRGGFLMVETVTGVVSGVRLRPGSPAYFINTCGVVMP